MYNNIAQKGKKDGKKRAAEHLAWHYIYGMHSSVWERDDDDDNNNNNHNDNDGGGGSDYNGDNDDGNDITTFDDCENGLQEWVRVSAARNIYYMRFYILFVECVSVRVYIVFSLVVCCVYLRVSAATAAVGGCLAREQRKIQNHHNICSKRFWTVAAVKRNPWRRVVLFLHHYHPNRTEQEKNSNRNFQIHTTQSKTNCCIFIGNIKT